MRPKQPPRPHNRGGVWYLIRRVPKEFAKIDTRGLVRISTEISVASDPRGVRARDAVAALNAELEVLWRSLRDGEGTGARARFEVAQKRAKSLHLIYQTNTELSDGPVSEIIKRLNILVDRGTLDSPQEASAVMGGESRPVFKVADLPGEFETINKGTNVKKSDNQMRKWRNPFILAATTFQMVVGNKPIGQLTRADTLKYRAWWQDRIVDEGVKINTANKNIGKIAKMYKTVSQTHQLNLPTIFADLSIAGGSDGQRIPFPSDFVQKRILAPGALDKLNSQARDLVYLVAEIGLRISEAVELDENTIHLNAKVPYVRILPLTRELKTLQSERDIPLVGHALASAKRNPKGFPRYKDKADSLSALVNNYLETHKLLPTPEHSFYGLRHTFEDRLTAVEAPEKLVASLMGHKWSRPRYGVGPSLEQKQKWLNAIAYEVIR